MNKKIFPREVWDELQGDFDLREDYTGRGMWGADTCPGLTGSLVDLLRFWAGLSYWAWENEDFDLAHELAGAVQSDNMGHETIYYFPGWTVGS